MRALHVPYTFHPDACGGTEVYVENLAALQRELGWETAIAAPAAAAARYDFAGMPVWRFATGSGLGLREMYGEGDSTAASGFGRAMDEFRPDVVHLHAFTSAVSVRLCEEAAKRGARLLVNYHTPTFSCPRGTLLRWGTEICDGALDTQTCGACLLESRGTPRAAAGLLAGIPPAMGRMMGRIGLEGGVWTAMRTSELVELRIGAFRRMTELADRVLALCEWTKRLLLLNGVTETKIALCRQGIVWNEDAVRAVNRTQGGELRLAFFGRLHPTKGIDVVLRAMALDRGLPLSLDLYCVDQGSGGRGFAQEVRRLAENDRRVMLREPLAASAVAVALTGYDALVVPSQWLETGPLVVLEAFAAGTPVIGSELGGIAELVRDRETGLLIRDYASPAAWLAALRQVCSQPDLAWAWRSAIRPPRRTRDVAQEMVAFYNEVLGGAAHA